ncbi:hypothetical protein GQX74_014210 [Glossina fuscipes]|nr:hypothetical protein GQX74_014210 [Glossina fuscipes]
MLVVIFTKQKSCEIKSLGQYASCLVNDFLILPWVTLPTLASSSRTSARKLTKNERIDGPGHTVSELVSPAPKNSIGIIRYLVAKDVQFLKIGADFKLKRKVLSLYICRSRCRHYEGFSSTNDFKRSNKKD